MRCPICRKHVEWAGNPYRPFCSERCKLIDLDNWLSERYRISTPADAQETGGAAEDASEETKENRD